MPAFEHAIYQIKVVLLDKLMIWHRLLIRDDTTITDGN
jgi:hypothetical protein